MGLHRLVGESPAQPLTLVGEEGTTRPPQGRGTPTGCRCWRDAHPGKRCASARDPRRTRQARQPDSVSVRGTHRRSGGPGVLSRAQRSPATAVSAPGSLWVALANGVGGELGEHQAGEDEDGAERTEAVRADVTQPHRAEQPGGAGPEMHR